MELNSTLLINFNNYDHNFCESSIYSNDKHPEYINALSSLFITFIGINALLKQLVYRERGYEINSFLHSILYSALTVNGITSSLYHYYNNIGWGLMDRMSMIIIAMSSVILFQSIINSILILEKYKNIIINNIINIIITSYFTILFTIAGLHMESLFNIMFSFFLIFLVFMVYIINKYYKMLEIPYQLVILSNRGILYVTISGIFWIITELLCNKFTFIKYLFGHVWWHIFVSYGGYLISLIPLYLCMKQNNYKIKINIVYDNFNIPYLDIIHFIG